jgi:hypothetical protein
VTTGTGLAAGASAAPFTVAVNTTGLVAGTYSGNVRITGAAGTANSPKDVPVTLKVESDPTIGLSPGALIFTITLGAANPPNQTVTVTNTGDLTLTWSAAGSVTTPVAGTWLGLSGVTTGSLTGGLQATFDVTADATGLAAGTYAGMITVSGLAGTTNTPQTIGVTFNVNAPASLIGSGKIPRAGYCGSVGFDVAFPLILLWAWRQWRRGRRSPAGLLPMLLIAMAFLTVDQAAQAQDEIRLPRTLAEEESQEKPQPESQEQPQERPTTMPVPAQEEKPDAGLLNLKALTLNGHAGVLVFTSDFKADPAFCGGVQLRVPSPWVSGLLSSEPDRLGFLLDLTGSSIKRDIGTQNETGGLLLITAGLYGAFYRTESFEAEAELALQYGYFGGVDKVSDGFAAVLGIRGAVNLGSQFWLTLNPQMAFGDAGSHVYILNAGLDIRF